MDKQTILEALSSIPPAALSYQDWCSVGMALKQEGLDWPVWDDWSRADARYHPGECERKWRSFHGNANPVSGKSILALAMEQGWRPDTPGREIGWDEAIGDAMIVDRNWIEATELPPAPPQAEWNPARELATYLETLFDSSDLVGYVTETWERDGKFLPQKGCYDRTAGQLLEDLSICDGDLGQVVGDWNPEAGAWIRFNPLDGKGVKNENVTEFRYALVESDCMPIEEQYALLQQLELPVACLVHSGGKSLHAIVRVEAGSYEEYRKRVDYLYEVCEKNGLKLDRQNRNPSRLSRMPGVTRRGQRQYLVATNLGKSGWNEWKEWVESVTDDLPDTETLAASWDCLPPLAPPLIEGILRKGHKLLLAGPSKAGKSFALIELCIAIAEGRRWLGLQCAQGRVLYVNLELDRASCLHRFRDVYEALGWPPEHLGNIDVWNLRGRSVPMNQLAPKLIRRASKRGYLAVIIDPIYKVITGDENSADQMAAFCNQFDKVCTELGCAVIYCHHHSKGAQGGKRAMDRASGSGVFARDPDALLDMIQLDLTEAIHRQREDSAVGALCAARLQEYGLRDQVPQDALCSAKAALEACGNVLTAAAYAKLLDDAARVQAQEAAVTGWRIEATLREFAAPPPKDLWFRYPIHQTDETGVLGDIQPESGEPAWKRNLGKSGKRSKTPEERKKERNDAVEQAYACCAEDGKTEISALAEYMGVAEKTVRRRLQAHGGFWVERNTVGKKQEGQTDK